jgi:molecular chaperone DnaJ
MACAPLDRAQPLPDAAADRRGARAGDIGSSRMAEPPADQMAGTATTEPRGVDLKVDLQLTFEEAAVGCTREIKVPRNEPCGACEGGGFVPGSSAAGCSECRGEGVHPRISGVPITVPAGVEAGQALRLLGKGSAIRGGKPGDLYVLLAVLPHPRFTRRGGDLIVEIEIAPELAASGGRVTVPLLVGERPADVRAGARTGDQIVLRGWGVQIIGAPPTPMPSEASAPYRESDLQGRGDLIVQLRVQKRGFGAWLRRRLHRVGSR